MENEQGLSNNVPMQFQSFTAEDSYTAVRVGIKAGWTFPEAGHPIHGGLYTVSGGLPDVELSSFTFSEFGHVSNLTIERTLLDTPVEIEGGTQYLILLEHETSINFAISGRRGFGIDYFPGGQWELYSFILGEWGEPGGGPWDMYFELYSEYSLSPTPSHEAIDILVFPVLSWVVD